MRTPTKRHFLLHTLEHLTFAMVILAIAFTLGALGKSIGVGATAHLAQTGSSGSTTDPYSTSGTSGSTGNVNFAVERHEIYCAEGQTSARYRFLISPESGGFIILTTASGPMYVDNTNGGGMERVLPLGAYVWTGGVRPGYVGAGSGSFTVEQVCTTSAPPPPPTTTSTTSSSTAGGETIPPPPPPPQTDSTNLVSVSFGVQPAPTTICSPAGVALTPVLLVVTREFGGRFTLNSDSGVSNAPYVGGEHNLANGHYRWNAVVNTGYVGEGPLSGEFDLSGTCQSVTTTPTTTVSATLPLVSGTPTPTPAVSTQNTQATNVDTSLPKLPRPQLLLFIDNIPVSSERTFNREEVEVRVKTAASDSVALAVYETGVASRILGKAERDDLLSQPGVDVWSYVVNMSELPEGRPKLQARVKHNDRRETQTEPLPISVAHPKAPAPKTSTVTLPPVREISPASGELRTSVRVSERDRAQVLSRVSDPSTCGSAEECQIYCRSLPGVNDLCLSFAREFVAPESSTTSLVADLPREGVARILAEFSSRPKELPDTLMRHEELVDYCALAEHFTTCADIVRTVTPEVGETMLEQKRGEIERARKEERTLLTERTGTRAYLDEDQDGVTDYDEVNIYKTDPGTRDSDDDGFDDGIEILARTNPLGGLVVTVATSTADATTTTTRSDETVLLQNPLIAGVVEAEILEVKTVEVLETGLNEHGSSTVKKLKVAGRALPNSFVTLYIFSDPIVVTVKADASGAWSYTLDKELPDGSHKVYSAITDAGGRILAKSEPLPFIKVASAVSLGADTLDVRATQEGFFTGASLYAMIAMLIGILGIALSIIGFIVRQKSDSGHVPGMNP